MSLQLHICVVQSVLKINISCPKIFHTSKPEYDVYDVVQKHKFRNITKNSAQEFYWHLIAHAWLFMRDKAPLHYEN